MSKDVIKFTFNSEIVSRSEFAEVFEVLLVGATDGAVLGSQQVARVTIAKSDSLSGVVRFLNQSLVTLVNPDSTLKLSLVLERAGGLVGDATVRGAAVNFQKSFLRGHRLIQTGFTLRQVAWILLGPNSKEVLPPLNKDIREPVNGSFFFSDGEEGTRVIELQILPHGEVEVEEAFVVELSILSGALDVDPRAGSVTLKIEKFGDPNGIVQFTEDALRERVYNEATDGPFNISLSVTRREGVVGNITVRFHSDAFYSLVKLIPLRVRAVMENLETSWNFKTVISRPGKLMEKT
ncbi:G-protein coupled receptor 98 [Liparis tanakae]|uniref:G-protein coupled receptor 98 n=1 Tax=Liparis tanakae TaxID=230148 RepID=A0A4Z2GAR0_9TELE|nr:G-protein coupled receptor 98 [Liparis tanakae]